MVGSTLRSNIQSHRYYLSKSHNTSNQKHKPTE